jgi:antitoxin YefM
MIVATISELRKNAKQYFDQIVEDQDILVISRGKGRSIVAMPLDRFNDMDTTDYLNSSKANREHLEKGIAQDRAGKTIKKTMEELRQYE